MHWNYLKRELDDFRRAATQWGRDDASMMAAAVSYYAVLSLIPLVMVLTAALSWVVGDSTENRASYRAVLEVVSDRFSPALSKDVERALDQVKQQAAFGGPIGLAVLLYVAINVFVHFERAFDRIWNVPSPPKKGILKAIRHVLVNRLAALLVLFALAILFAALFVANIALSSIEAYASALLPDGWRIDLAIRALVNVLVNGALLTLVFRLLPKRPVGWWQALRGGLLASIVWEAGREILAHMVLGNRVVGAFGVAGALVAVMIWIYYAACVMFLAAEYVQVLCTRCEGSPDH